MRRVFISAVLLLCSGALAEGGWDEALEAYRHGDFTTIYNELLPLAMEGDADAQYEIGIMSVQGQGVTKNEAEAEKWFRSAAEQGHTAAQHNLGVIISGGGNSRNIPQDLPAASKWLRKAARKGYAQSQINLAIMYMEGRGVPKDYAKAEEWLLKAAEKRYVLAQYNLGYLYFMWKDAPQNYIKAEEWLLKAAEQGHSLAQNTLGIMFGTGQGVRRDNVQAYMWFHLAAASGNTKGGENMNFAETQMTPDQVAKAREMALKWREGFEERKSAASSCKNSKIRELEFNAIEI